MKIKISESDFLVIWDALHTEATIEAVALALKLARARAYSRSNKTFRRGAVASQKKHVKKSELLQVVASQKQGKDVPGITSHAREERVKRTFYPEQTEGYPRL